MTAGRPMSPEERVAADIALRKAYIAKLKEALRAQGITPDSAGRLERADAEKVRRQRESERQRPV